MIEIDKTDFVRGYNLLLEYDKIKYEINRSYIINEMEYGILFTLFKFEDKDE